MTDDQVSEILGDLINAEHSKIPILLSIIGLGLLIRVCGACRWKKYSALNKEDHTYEALERKKLVDEQYKNIRKGGNNGTLAVKDNRLDHRKDSMFADG